MKKRFILPLAFLLILLSLAFVSCTTAMPYSCCSNSVSVTLENGSYKVLGSVSHEYSAK